MIADGKYRRSDRLALPFEEDYLGTLVLAATGNFIDEHYYLKVGVYY